MLRPSLSGIFEGKNILDLFIKRERLDGSWK